LSNAARFSGDLEGALQAIRESRSIAEKLAAPDDHTRTLTLAAALWREARILGDLDGVSMNRPADAVPLLEKALDLAEDLAARDPVDYTSRTYVSMAGMELGDILRHDSPTRALAVYDATRNRLAEIQNNPKARRDEASALAASSYPLRRLHRSVESKQRVDEALAILRDLQLYPAPTVEMGEAAERALRALADYHADTGDTDAAVTTYEELLDKVQAGNPQPQTDLRHANGLSRIYSDLANLHRRAGHPSRAGVLDQQRQTLWRYWSERLPHNPFVERQVASVR
jgi:hypothetical protein